MADEVGGEVAGMMAGRVAGVVAGVVALPGPDPDWRQAADYQGAPRRGHVHA